MKRITAILLILLLLFDSFGYIFVYLELSSYFKKEAAGKINDFIPENELEIISFHKTKLLSTVSSLNFVKEKEIKINGTLYDIYKIEYRNDSVFIFCLNDKNENILEKAFTSYVDRKINDKTSRNPIHNIIHNLIKVALAPATYCQSYYQSSIKFTTTIKDILPQFSKEIPSPPPKNRISKI